MSSHLSAWSTLLEELLYIKNFDTFLLSPVVNFLIKQSYPDFEVQHLRVPVIYLSALNVNASLHPSLLSPSLHDSATDHQQSSDRRVRERMRGRQFINCSAHNWISLSCSEIVGWHTTCCCFHIYFCQFLHCAFERNRSRSWEQGRESERERERDCVSVLIFVFCTFSLTFCFLAQKLVDELMSFYWSWSETSAHRSLFPGLSISLSLLFCLILLSFILYIIKMYVCYKKPKAHLSWSLDRIVKVCTLIALSLRNGWVHPWSLTV